MEELYNSHTIRSSVFLDDVNAREHCAAMNIKMIRKRSPDQHLSSYDYGASPQGAHENRFELGDQRAFLLSKTPEIYHLSLLIWLSQQHPILAELGVL